MKKDFYIFSDIKGVLNSTLWQKKFKEFELGKQGYFKDVCPDNMEELNILIKKLSKKYNVKLVITAPWHMNFEKTKKLLVKGGLAYKDEILFTTPTEQKIRGLEINEFTEKNNLKGNYVVIDTGVDDVRPYIPAEKIIHPFAEYGLSNTDVTKYINKHKRLFETAEENIIGE